MENLGKYSNEWVKKVVKLSWEKAGSLTFKFLLNSRTNERENIFYFFFFP